MVYSFMKGLIKKAKNIQIYLIIIFKKLIFSKLFEANFELK